MTTVQLNVWLNGKCIQNKKDNILRKGINDITCEYDSLNNFVKTNFNDVEILQIKLNCQYTEYHEFLSNVRTSIKNYLIEEYNNCIEREDSNEQFDGGFNGTNFFLYITGSC